MGSDLDPDAPISSLPAAERSLVAIGRALAIKSDILVLDEPTAALPEADVERLLETLRRLRASNIGIVYVTHRLDEVLRIADRVTVLRDGRRLATVAARETNAGDLVQMIVGRSMSDAFVRPTLPSRRSALTVEDLVAEHVGPVSFSVAAGETLGLVGLRGAGHHTVGRAIFGHTPMEQGRLTLDGEPIAPLSPAEAMAKGVGFVSSRRAEEGLASNLDVRENIYLNPAASGKGVLEFVPRATELSEARSCGAALFHQDARACEEPVATLSGGNQQKVVLARWMEAHVKLLILEEPTIGVDVGAKADIYHLLQLSLSKGLAVLLISSDFEEVERICHRALVFSRGRVAAEIAGRRIDHRRVDFGRVGWDLDRPPRSGVMSRGAAGSFGAVVTRAISVWGLLVLFVLLVIVFSLLRPDTFLTYFNIRSILSNKSVQLLVALSVFIPMVANQFDLSAGFNVGISQVLAIGLQGQGLPWWAAVCAVLLMGAAVGLANGLLITRVKIDSFIATLGTGTILYGLNAWYTGGQQVLASLPPEFLAISGSVWIVPAPAIYALVVSLTLWIVFEYPAARPLPLCARREPAGGGAQRDFGQAIHHARLRRRRNARRLRRRRAAIAVAGRPKLGRAGISVAGLHRGAPRRDVDPAGPRQRLGDGARRRRAGGDRRRPQPARRAVLCRAAVQWLDADPGGRPRGAGGGASPAPRHASGEGGGGRRRRAGRRIIHGGPP